MHIFFRQIAEDRIVMQHEVTAPTINTEFLWLRRELSSQFYSFLSIISRNADFCLSLLHIIGFSFLI